MYNARLFLDVLLTFATLLAPLFHSTPASAPVAAELVKTPAAPRRAPERHTKAKGLVAHSRTYTVTATIYEAVPGQTDDEPFITADNSQIKPHYGTKKRWMALSRDLLKPWGGDFKFGDNVRVTGISEKLDGVYTVHDTMNKRHRHCMDILAHASENMDIFTKGVKIQKVAVR